jgi:hypothetical protein
LVEVHLSPFIMETFTLLVLALNIFALATAGVVHPRDFECDPEVGGAFPDETACEKYYICANGEAKPFTCPADQLFDLVYDGCNFAELVNCGDRPRPPGYASTVRPITTKEPGVTPDPGYTCPEPGGAFEHPEFCELYYICVEDVPTLHICDGDLLFDTVYSGCNFPELTDCGDRKRPNGTVTVKPTNPPVTGDDGFECPSAGGAFPHDTKCELYYVCVDSVPTLETCPADQLFDLIYEGCNFEELVDCGDRERPIGSGTNKPTEPTQTPGTGPTDPPGSEFECPEAAGIFADPEDCSGFYQCDNNIASHSFCPDSLYFSDVIFVCDHQANVDCGSRPEP